MIDPKKGDHVVVLHPFMRDRHVVALVEKVAPTMCDLRYVTRRGTKEEVNRRRRDHFVGVLPPGADPLAISDQLRERGEALFRQETQARKAYLADVTAITQGRRAALPNPGDD